jgi:nucleotide-binding universal stress UspA family protein
VVAVDRFEAMNSVRRVERPGDGSRLLVVGCDGSPASRNALAYAVGLSRRERAHLVVVVVREPKAVIAFAPWAVAAEHWAPSVVDLVAEVERLLAERGVRHEVVVRDDDIAHATEVEAELRGADAVIVGRRRGWRRRGAAAAKLLRHVRCTVIAVA